MNDPESAKRIATQLLDITGRALTTGDADLFSSCFLFPQDIETFDGKRRIETPAEMNAVFFEVLSHYEKQGVTDIVRHCVTSDFRDATTISSIHQARLLRGTNLVQKPYNAFSVLRLVDGSWKIAQSQYAVDDSPSLCRALIGAQPVTHA